MFRIGGIVENSLIDAEGISRVIFFQGCKKRCQGCHNPQFLDFNAGEEITEEEALYGNSEETFTDWIDVIVLCGGEPLDQPEAVRKISKLAHESKKQCWLYTGNILENIDPEFLEDIDVVIDGEWKEELQCKLQFRSSSNQRLFRKVDGKWIKDEKENS